MRARLATESTGMPVPGISVPTASRSLEEALYLHFPFKELTLQGREGGRISFGPSANDHVDGRNPLQDVRADDLPESSLQLVTLHNGASMLGNDEAYAWMMEKGSDDPELEMLSTNSLPFAQYEL